MIRVSIGDMDSDYNLYAVIAFIVAMGFLIMTLGVIFMSTEHMGVRARDYANGALLAATLFGTPVSILLGIAGVVFSKAEHTKGRLMAMAAIIMPIIFLVALFAFWYPRGIGFWDHNFSSIHGIQVSQ